MPSQNGPSERVKELIASKGGHIWTTTTDVVAGGAAVAGLVFEQPYVPTIARMLLGWRPIENVTDGAVEESLLSVFSLSGSNYRWQPQEVICGTLGDSILLTSNILIAHSEYYDVFAPVSGGEQIDANVEPCDAIAGNRRSSIEFTWSDVRIDVPVIYSQCSREIAVGAAAGIVAGTTITISGGKKLIEVGAVHTHAAITIEEESTTQCVIKSTGLHPVNELKFSLEPVGGVNDEAVDEGAPLAHLARRTQRLSIQKETAVVTCDFDVDVALSAAGQAVHMLRWI